MSNEFDQFKDAFFEEAAEHLAIMEDGLLQLERSPGDLDLLNKIFRSAHSIKGASGMFGFDLVAQFTHKMETLLDLLRSGKKAVTPPISDLLLKSTDCLKLLIDAAKSNEPTEASAVQQLTEVLAAACSAESRPSPSVSPAPTSLKAMADSRRTFDIHWTPPQNLFQRGLDPLQVFNELNRIGTVSVLKVDTSRLPDLHSIDPESCYLSWNLRLETPASEQDVRAVFEFVEEDGKLTITEVSASAKTPEATPRDFRSAPMVTPLESEEAAPKPLGSILVESGVISKETLDRALAMQKRVGEILIEQNAVTPQQVEEALQKQRQMEAAIQAKKTDPTSIRVDTAKIDKLINLVGELVITQSMLSDLGARFDMKQLHVLQERIAQLERNTREIQERVMSIRMVPIGMAFSRFPRLVRDLAAKLGKKIQLVLSGEETELDKTVIEAIGDPLTHLVRNAADHGLEPPEERLDNNKPETGVIKLNAFHESGNICITVEDDGRGLNRDKILAKAIRQGLVQEGASLSDDQIYSLIMKPGFSTADQVSDLSGRGVGMDVVKRNIEALGGTVSIKTALGKGTTFTLKLPLTLAIIEGMTIRVGRETYIVPMLSILESIRPKSEALKTIVGKGELIDVRGVYLPVIRLYEVFNVEPEHRDPAKAILLVVETEGERVAVMVDEIIGQQQVVIKSMEQNFRKVEGIAGATILGDGTVGFILDARGLLALARQGVSLAA
jgi:two-component system chemotaxis sensor kinase CheA